MISKSIFREYDIRGIVGGELNEHTVKLIGYFLGVRIYERQSECCTPYVAVGYDARTHSPELFSYLASGLNASGCKVLNMGMVATGVNYFANFNTIDDFNVNATVMITGSHNPSEYNGFKITVNKKPFFGEDIYALGRTIIANQIKEIRFDDRHTTIDVKTPYINYIVNQFSHLKGLNHKFIIDCGNGVADTVLTEIFDKLELKYDGLYCEPDGTFPNHHPDPSDEHNLVDLKQELLKDEYEFAFAYDGDADRIAFLTKKYNVKGDIMAILFAKTMTKPTVIGEVKCSQIMYDIINTSGGKAIMYKTGHSNLKVKLVEEKADFACEVSGHIFFADRYFGYDDAIYATFRVLELIANGMDIDKEISNLPIVYSTEELKVKTTEEAKFVIIEKLKNILQNPPKDFPIIKDIIDVDGLRIVFENGWALVRASNTTPILVTRFESTDKQLVTLYEKKVNELIVLASK
ncbi:phosphomannomutase/phosphoglucomutase [Arcobacter sp. FWKO B]|uniref:phosphomannomutase/phosphoglucomutase n=1 Tax=Arcobacter sp. FWKO B TaxID=2593672 RepID=UPI0018A5118C|nr:phosphomannomutase/phosphoglucomutase [Arcobacter sp. FWKO B]QOG12554.1 phosphomannomutase/phosphoglucomutase [Arcobacter sp. FWKO B]